MSTTNILNTSISSTNTSNTIVARDGSGNFSAGTITGIGLNLSGLTASGVVVTDGSKNLGTVASTLTYTPTMGDGTNNFTTSTASGVYYKIGPIVFVQVQIVWTGKGSASSGSQIQLSLPVAIGSSSPRVSGSIGFSSGISFTGSFLQLHSNAGLSYLLLAGASNAGVENSITVSQLSTSGEVQFFLCYWSN